MKKYIAMFNTAKNTVTHCSNIAVLTIELVQK